MPVKTQLTTYQNFGRCLKLSNGTIEALVTLDVGPRMISFSLCGGKNVMKEDLEREISQNGPQFDGTFYPGAAWYIYGGHRIWTSPEHMPLSYYPDNDPVEYRIEGGTVIFTPPAQTVRRRQHVLAVTMSPEGGSMKVSNRVQNISDKPQEYAVWALTVMAPGGFEIIPQPSDPTGLLANRVLSVWEYTDMSDPRVKWGKKYITLKQDPEAETAFKIGINNTKGWGMYLVNGCVFTKRYQPVPGAAYPDFGVHYETYTNHSFMEVETLGELKAWQPGETAVHDEFWQLKAISSPPCPKDEEEIDRFVLETQK